MGIRAKQLKIAAYIVLGCSLLVGGFVYFTQAPVDNDIIGYENLGGVSYPIRKSDSRKLRAQLERTGGKFALWEDDLNDWYLSLWQGRQLGETIAILGVLGWASLLFSAKVKRLLDESNASAGEIPKG